MTRAFVARALHALGTLVAGHDPAALAIAEAARARAEAERAVDLARLALTSAEVAAVHPRLVDAARVRAEHGSLPAVTVARSRELLADLADAEDEPPRVAGGDD